MHAVLNLFCKLFETTHIIMAVKIYIYIIAHKFSDNILCTPSIERYCEKNVTPQDYVIHPAISDHVRILRILTL